jgi:ubiquinone/menaquinone biosynthesis C-methylase UbiE
VRACNTVSGDDAAAKRASSRDHFDRWAHQYERDQVSRWLATLQRQALDALELGPSDQLIDVGCGTGAAVRAAAPTVRHSVGVDLSPGMLDRARELASGAANVEFRVADAEALPFRDSTFSACSARRRFITTPPPSERSPRWRESLHRAVGS